MQKLEVTNRETGAVIASVLLNPCLRSEFWVELNEKFERVLTVRTIPGENVANVVPIGDANIKVIVENVQ